MSTQGRRKIIRWMAACLGVAIAFGLTAILLRPAPRDQRTRLADLLDEMKVPLKIEEFEVIESHQTTRALATKGPAAIPELQPVLEQVLMEQSQADQTFFRHSKIWVVFDALTGSRLGIQAPKQDATREQRRVRILSVGTYYLLRLSPTPAAGLAAVSRLIDSADSSRANIASLAFAAIPDPDMNFFQGLTNLIATSRGRKLAFWLNCLSQQGERAASAAPLIKGCIAGSSPEVRQQALEALACVKPDEETFQYLEELASSQPDRRSVVAAYFRIGTKASSREPFIRKALNDPDIWTAMYARWSVLALSGDPVTKAQP